MIPRCSSSFARGCDRGSPSRPRASHQGGAARAPVEAGSAALLRSHSLEPRHTILLIGPPGTGKTSLAGAIAAELALPFLTVRYEGLVGSYLGETAGRLQEVVDYVSRTPCVLFFDEFDSVGKERSDAQETGEIKRVVSSLLLQMDALPSHCVVVCATNHRSSSTARSGAASRSGWSCPGQGRPSCANGTPAPNGPSETWA